MVLSAVLRLDDHIIGFVCVISRCRSMQIIARLGVLRLPHNLIDDDVRVLDIL
jgi:hypothetical protein